MKQVTMVEFRKKAQEVLGRVMAGERMLLTYRGRPVLRLEPVLEKEPREDDPFYQLPAFAVNAGQNMSNREMDRVIYES